MPAFFIQLHWAEKAKILASNNTAPKRKRGRPENMIFGEGGIHELKHLFFPEGFYEPPETFAGHKEQLSSGRISVLC